MDYDSLKIYRDLKNSLDLAREEGIEEGKIQGIKEGKVKGIEEGKVKEKRQVVINSLKSGLSVDIIAQITGLSPAEVENIKREAGIR